MEILAIVMKTEGQDGNWTSCQPGAGRPHLQYFQFCKTSWFTQSIVKGSTYTPNLRQLKASGTIRSGIKKANSLQSGTTKLEATHVAFISDLIIVDLTTFQP